MTTLLCSLSLAAQTPTLAQAPTPQGATAQADYDVRSLHISPHPGGYLVMDGRGRALTPATFAKRSEDWWTWQRIDYQARLTKTVVSTMYLVGGLSVLGGANVVPLMASGFDEPQLAALTRISGAALVLGGLGFVGGGYVMTTRSQARQAEAGEWWTQERAQELVEAHNQELAQELHLAPPRPLSVRPVIGPGTLALVGQF